jgi:hypothetical protein
MLDAHKHKLSHLNNSKKNSWLLYYYRKVTICTEDDATDIRRHMETWNGSQHELQAPLNTRRIRDKNTNSVPNSI